MSKNDLPITVSQFYFLQAYLFEIFRSKKECKNNFEYTEYYLEENYSVNEIKQIENFLIQNNLNCDCDLITKLDLRKYSLGFINFHE
ncbi:MAG: hypothetical protein KJ571_10055 [Bacteroidetes bacterium]|nr:hypothetical protein [Bacteroidota bacterium]